MQTEGELTLDGRKVPVRGLSWMDHEFGTSFLEPEQVGWDWFSIQLDDGTDLMLFQLRRADASWDSRSTGAFVEAGGRTLGIRVADFQLTPETSWKSADSGAILRARFQERRANSSSFDDDRNFPREEDTRRPSGYAIFPK